MRLTKCVSVCAAMTLALAASASAASYTVQDLSPWLYFSYTMDINDSGQIAGNGWAGALVLDADTGGATLLPSLGGGNTTATGINELGWVTGSSFTSGGNEHAFIWDGVAMTDLGTLGGPHSYGMEINDQGDVGGYSYLPNLARHALFAPYGGPMQELPTLGGTHCYGRAVNNAGQVAGESLLPGNSIFHAFLWDGGAMIDLGTLGGDFSSAWAVNEAGQVVGRAYTTPNPYSYEHGFIWEDGVMTDLGVWPGGYHSQAWDINDLGQIVGGSTYSPSGNSYGILWEGGTMYNLNDLVPAAYQGQIVNAIAINNAGQILALGENGSTPLLLSPASPVPAPGAMVLGMIGVAALGVMRRSGRRV